MKSDATRELWSNLHISEGHPFPGPLAASLRVCHDEIALSKTKKALMCASIPRVGTPDGDKGAKANPVTPKRTKHAAAKKLKAADSPKKLKAQSSPQKKRKAESQSAKVEIVKKQKVDSVPLAVARALKALNTPLHEAKPKAQEGEWLAPLIFESDLGGAPIPPSSRRLLIQAGAFNARCALLVLEEQNITKVTSMELHIKNILNDVN